MLQRIFNIHGLSHAPFFFTFIPALVFILFLSGCAAPQQFAERRYVWPPAPEIPRVEFLAAYWGGADFPKKGFAGFLEALTGAEHLKLDRPWGVTSDGEGKIYVTDINAAAVVIFDTKAGSVSLMGGKELAGTFENPIGLALDAAGNIYVSDSKKKMVFVFSKNGEPLTTIGGPDTLTWPVGLAVNDRLGRLYVADSQGHNIAVFDLSGKHLFTFGKSGGRNGQFRYPNSLAIAPDGSIVVADTINARVQVFDADGNFIRAMGRRGDGPTDLQIPKGIGVTKAGHIYVTDGRGHKIVIFSMEGHELTSIGGRMSYASVGTAKLYPGGFLQPTGLFIDKNDTIYVADSFNARIQVFQELNEEYLKKRPIEGKTEEILKSILKERKGKYDEGEAEAEAGDSDRKTPTPDTKH